jgi:hypothetical protein
MAIIWPSKYFFQEEILKKKLPASEAVVVIYTNQH